jgi:hypothetical protein
MATIKNTNNNKCSQAYGEKGIILHCWCKCKLVYNLYGKQYGSCQKIKNRAVMLSINSAPRDIPEGM